MEAVTHAPHKCLSCSGTIQPSEPEVRHKLGMAGIRYAHESFRDCQAALARPATGVKTKSRGKARGRARKYRGNPDRVPVMSPEEFSAL